MIDELKSNRYLHICLMICTVGQSPHKAIRTWKVTMVKMWTRIVAHVSMFIV